VSERKRDVVKSYLSDRLVRGCYRFGEKISAKEVSEQTNASRFMVNTALNELRAEGFLEITAQVGCEVVRPSLTEITDFFVVFSRLEGAMAEFAAQRRQAGDIAQLRWINDRLRTLDPSEPSSGEAYRTLNLEFHQAVHTSARSPRQAERQFMHWAMADFLVTQASDFQLHVSDSILEHDAVVAAIERGDTHSARVLMETHIRRLGQDVVANLEGLPAGTTALAVV
jgi:DNA-binding GntR family transcriptional regulator